MAHAEIFNLQGEKLLPVRMTADELVAYRKTPEFHMECGKAPIDPETHQCSWLKDPQALCRFDFAKAFDVVNLPLCLVEAITGKMKQVSFDKVKNDEPKTGVSDSTEW